MAIPKSFMLTFEVGGAGVSEKARQWATASKSWAVGGTGARDGENTDNAKFYATQASDAAGKAYGMAILGGAIGLIERDAEYGWIQGSIDGSTGTHDISDMYHISTLTNDSYGYPYLDASSRITCDANHKFYVTIGFRAVGTIAYSGVVNPLTGKIEAGEIQPYHYTQDLFLGGLKGRSNTGHDRYRITLARVDGEEISATDTDFTVHTYRATDETLKQANIPADAKETGKKIGVMDIDVASGTLISGKTINASNKIAISTIGGATTEIARNSDWSALAIDANSERATIITFLTDSIAELSGGDSIDGILATGETGRRMIDAGGSARFVLPDDCTVIAITTKSSNNDHTPDYIAGISDHSAAWYAEYVVGKLPAKDIPAPPSSNGTYTLRATVSSGTVTYSWVSG